MRGSILHDFYDFSTVQGESHGPLGPLDLNGPNKGEHLALQKKGSAEKPCLLSDCSKGSRGSSPPVQKARFLMFAAVLEVL